MYTLAGYYQINCLCAFYSVEHLDQQKRLSALELQYDKIDGKMETIVMKLEIIERFVLQQGPQSQLPPPAPAARSNRPNIPLTVASGRLPSSSIKKLSLKPAATIIRRNSDLAGKEGKVGTLALLLARECFFGEDVMVRCTTHGHGDKHGLPWNELMELKEEIKKTFPQYWNAPHEFELLWNKCTEAISQGCKRLRGKKRPTREPLSCARNVTPTEHVHSTLV